MATDITNNRDLICLKEGHYIDIFSLEDADDNYFGNYQRYDFFQILWLKEVNGNNSYSLDFNEYSLEDKHALIIFPGQIDRMDIVGKKGYIYAIENNLFFEINMRLQSAFLNGYYGNVFLPLDKATEQKLETLTSLLKEEIESKNRLSLLRTYMEAYLIYLIECFKQTDTFQKKEDTTIGELMRLIDIHFIEYREINFYSKKMNTTNKQLNKLSISGTGKTVKQHLQDRLLLEAKKEIRLNNKSLKEIAFDLGFNEAAYFSRFFKKQTSLSPLQFRKLR